MRAERGLSGEGAGERVAVYPMKHLPWLLAFAIASASAQTPGGGLVSRDATHPEAENEGHYPVPYQRPTAGEITGLLLRVKDHAGRLCAPRLVNGKATPGGYPVGVLLAGMLAAGDATGDRSFTDYVRERLQFIADNLPADPAAAATMGYRNFVAPGSLDACGAWGAALVKARRAGVGPDLLPVINRWADWVHHRQSRLPDGTFYRPAPQPDSIWGDDMFMSVPFLAQMGRLTQDPAYFDDAAAQVIQISSRLFIWPKGIYAHGWNAGNPDYNPEFYWGRANGWCMMAVCELLDNLPADHPARPAALKLLRTQAQALANLQSSNGLWHQLLDKPDSFLETSCSAMFTYCLAHAVNQGWINAPSYGPLAQAGWNGVSSQVGADGAVNHVCVGTNYAQDGMYYYNRPEHDDQHGYGPVLLAGAEMIRLIRNPHLSIRYSGATCVVTVK